MKRKSISKIIEIYLLAGIFALQGIGPVARPAYAAKASSQNALRLAHSLEVIQGYLGEVKKVIAEANDDAGKEYIAETVLKELNRTSPSPLEYLKSDPGTKEFKVFADKVSKARGEYNQSGDASGVYLFTLAMVNGLFPGRMLYLSKAKESPFPNEGASAWYMALQARNTKIVVALNAYLEAIDKKMTSLLTKNDGVVSDKSYAELSKVANEVALFSWNLSKTITLYKLIQAQKRYKRANEFYAAFVAYSEACSSLFSEFGDYTEATMPGIKNSEQHFYWSETTVHAGPVLRTGWYNFSCKTMTTVYVKALNGSSWYIWQGSGGSGSNQSYFEQDYAGISGKVDLAASEREMREYVSNLDQYSVDWPNIPDFEATILAKYMGYLEECDKAYDNKLAEVNKLVKELNSILNKYRKDFPYETPFSVAIIDEQSGAFYGIPISFTEGYNRFPQPVPGTYPPVKIPEKVVLDAKASSDPDKDKLNYRWVITGIPKWPQAKSKKYVLYQKLTDSQTAEFTPDLAGTWEMTLEVNDGKDAREATTNIEAIRKILWIAHSNGRYDPETGLGIELVLYDPKTAQPPTKPEATEWGGPYYVEVSHEKAGVYQNYDDEGKPVDEIIYSNSCFSIFNKTKITHDATGCYDGLYGSTYLAREKVGKPVKYKAGAFELKSASSYFTGLKAEIYVQVTDVEITELVLANEDCPYGQPLGASREGTYFIKQWVDFSEWHQRVNGDKVTLEEVKGAHITGSDPIIDTTADWLERRAAEVLNTTFPEVVPYVVRIFLEGDPNKSGLAKTRRKEIYINPAMKSNRYNLGSCMYAFCNRAALDGIARHEAYHCFYFWTVDKLMDNSFKYRDDDPSPANDIPKGDGLPDETGGPVSGATGNKFEYTLDVGDNRYGGFGPIGKGMVAPQCFTGFDYAGSLVADPQMRGRMKTFARKIPFTKLRGLMNNWDNPIELYLPKNLPIHDNFISEFKGVVFLKVRLANGQDKAIILENEYHYALRFSEQKTLSPKLKLIFWHREAWDELFNNKGFSEDQVEGIYINYKIENPPSHGAANEEYDASRIEPGVYTGNW